MKQSGKTAVLMGGTSNEREVSLISGENVFKALASIGSFEVTPVILNHDSLSELPADVARCYLALHGGYGENGGVQADLDARGIPYTGPGAIASKLAMDKIATKRQLDVAGVPTAHWIVLPVGESTVPASLSYPLVVKAPRDGSSVGVYLVKEEKDFVTAVAAAQKIDADKGGPGEALVESFIPGREVTVGVLDECTLPVVEIVARSGWYGYDEKYNSDETRYPVWDDTYLAAHPEDRELAVKLQQLARRAFEVCGCRGITRVDFRVTPAGEPYALELNTSPGMTGHSLVPKAAAAINLGMPELCLRILNSARCDFFKKGNNA